MNRIANGSRRSAEPAEPNLSPLVGKAVTPEHALDVARPVGSYFSEQPDPDVATQAIGSGTPGHRGSTLNKTFNENHVLAITQAICLYRRKQSIDSPLFLGIDTQALSKPAF